MLIDIAELARRSGVPASTLRFYEEKGLIDPSAGAASVVYSSPPCSNGWA